MENIKTNLSEIENNAKITSYIEMVNDVGVNAKVQMIGLAICTTPKMLKSSIEEMSTYGEYVGITDFRKDIDERLNFVIASVNKAASSTSIDKSSGVRKIFVVPEFFFRGIVGAYNLGNVSPETFFGTYFYSRLKTAFGTSEYNKWTIILGTILTSSQDVKTMKDRNKETQELYELGNNLISVYKKYNPNWKSSDTELLSLSFQERVRHILKRIDELNSDYIESETSDLVADEDPFVDVLRAALNYCDLYAQIYVNNHSYIINCGINFHCIRSTKQYKSKEDFVLNTSNYLKPSTTDMYYYTESIVRHKDLNIRSDIKQTDLDDYAIFPIDKRDQVEQYKWIGLEICLDHRRQRLLRHLKTFQTNYVDLQIITSCGMSIRDYATIARNDHYVFCCDGQHIPEDSNGGICSHTALKRIVTPINPSDKEPKAVLSGCVKLSDKIELMCNKAISPQEKCHIHIYPSITI